MRKIKIPASKRLKVNLFAFIINILLFWYGMYKRSDLTSLGAGLAFINAPIMAYLGAETVKPSVKKREDDI